MKKKIFQYKAKDAQGRIRSGKAVALDNASVRKSLADHGYSIESITEEKSIFDKLFTSNKISAKERSVLYKEMATMLKAGLSITQCIEIVADSPNKKMKRVLSEVSKSLENGFSLSVAMTSFPKTFPQVEVGVVKAGEATGNLAQVLLELGETTHRSAEFLSRVKGAMIYPAFIMSVLVVVGSVILVKVIPPIKEIFSQSGQELPMTTQILLWVTDMIKNYWYYLILGVLVIVGLVKLYLMTKSGKRVSSVLSLKTPVMGELIADVYLARFSRTLSLLIGAGVPIIEAIDIIRNSTANIIFYEIFSDLIKALEQGAAISTSLKKTKYFPKMMTQLLYVGQQSGDLGGVAKTLADYYEEEVDAKLRIFSSLMEPFIIVVMGVGIGFIVISVLQPIYNLTGSF